MACYHPSEVAVERKLLGQRKADFVTVPCGSCLGCRADQARQWMIRIVHEGLVTDYHKGRTIPPMFVTLTYEDKRIPENGSLAPEDFRLFIKRLRRFNSGRRLTYYGCGEYGSVTDRPHYHAVLFGADFPDRIEYTRRNGAPVWVSEALGALWPSGLHELTASTPATAAYVAGYVRKKVSKRYNRTHYSRVNPLTGELVEIQQEFSRMSRRPAIGRRWIEQFWRDVYPRDFVVIEGRPMKPPRYYDKWMEDNQPEVMEEVRYQRYLDAEHIGDEKLIMKEKVHRARVDLFQPRSAI